MGSLPETIKGICYKIKNVETEEKQPFEKCIMSDTANLILYEKGWSCNLCHSYQKIFFFITTILKYEPTSILSVKFSYVTRIRN